MNHLDWLAHLELNPLSGRFDWWPVSLRVRSAHPGLLRWIHAHLACTFTSTTQACVDAEFSVIALADETVPRRLAEAMRGQPHRLCEGFAGQWWRVGKVSGCTVWHRAPGSGSEQVLVRFAADRWLVASGGAEATALATVRLCRELLRTELARAPAMVVHGALACHAGLGGVLYVGTTGAGKTTLALGTAHGSGHVVSTDQTALLATAAGRPLGVGIPNASRVAAGTMRWLVGASGRPLVPMLRDHSKTYEGHPTADKVWITSLEIEVLYGIASAPYAGVDVIVLVRPDGDAATPRAEPAGPDLASRVLAEEFRPTDPLVREFWLAVDEDRPIRPAGTTEDLMALVEGVPVVDLVWDPTRHRIADALASLALVMNPPE